MDHTRKVVEEVLDNTFAWSREVSEPFTDRHRHITALLNKLFQISLESNGGIISSRNISKRSCSRWKNVRPSKPTCGSWLTKRFSIIFYLDSLYAKSGHEPATKMHSFFKAYLDKTLQIERKLTLDLIQVAVSVFHWKWSIQRLIDCRSQIRKTL